MKKITVEVSKCTGCGQCMMTCAFNKTGAFDLRRSHIRVVQWEDICLSVPVVCRQCADAPCIEACPSRALSRHPVTGAITVDEDACTGCEACVQECTYQVLRLSAEGIPVTCDLCGGNPACVASCYPGALSFVELPDGAPDPLREVAAELVARAAGKNVAPPEALRRKASLA